MDRIKSFFTSGLGPIEITENESKAILNKIIDDLNKCTVGSSGGETSNPDDLEDIYINSLGTQILTKETIVAQILEILNVSEKNTVGSIANAIDLPRSVVAKALDNISIKDNTRFLMINQDRIFTSQFINRIITELGCYFSSDDNCEDNDNGGVAIDAPEFCAREVIDMKTLHAVIARHNASAFSHRELFIDGDLILCREFLNTAKMHFKTILNDLHQPTSLERIFSSSSLMTSAKMTRSSPRLKDYMAQLIVKWATKDGNYVQGKFALKKSGNEPLWTATTAAAAVFTPTVYMTQLKTISLADLDRIGYIHQSRLKEASIKYFKKPTGRDPLTTQGQLNNDFIVLTDFVVTPSFLNRMIAEATRKLTQYNYLEAVTSSFPELGELGQADSRELLKVHILPALMERNKGLCLIGGPQSNFYTTREFLTNTVRRITGEFAKTQAIKDIEVFFQTHTIAEIEQGITTVVDITETVLGGLANVNIQELTTVLLSNQELDISNRTVCELLALRDVMKVREAYETQARISIKQYVACNVARLKIYLNGLLELNEYDTKLATKLLQDTLLEYAEKSLGLYVNKGLMSLDAIYDDLSARYYKGDDDNNNEKNGDNPSLGIISKVHDEILTSLKVQLARTKPKGDTALVLHLAVLITYGEWSVKTGKRGLLKATGKYVPKILKIMTKMADNNDQKELLDSFMRLKEFIMMANKDSDVEVQSLVNKIKQDVL